MEESNKNNILENQQNNTTKTSLLQDQKMEIQEEIETTDSNKYKYRNIGKVIYLSLSFMIYFSAANSGLLTNSEIYDQKGYKNLGNASELILFSFSGIASILSPFIISNMQYRWRFSIASIAYILFMGCGILVTNCPNKDSHFYCSNTSMFTIVVILSSITGIMNVILFLTQNQYISELTNDKNKGLLFGCSWALLQFAYCIGNIYSSYIIIPLGQQNYFVLMTLICVLGGVLFLFVKQPPAKIKFQEEIPLRQSQYIEQEQQNNENIDHQQQDQEEEEQDLKISIQQQQQTDTNQSESEQENKANQNKESKISQEQQDDIIELFEHENESFGQYMKQLYQVTKNPVFRRLIPYFLQSGIILSFQFGLFYTVIQHSLNPSLTHEEVNQRTFKVLIFLGIGESIGGTIIAKISDIFGNVNAAGITNLVFFMAIFSTMLAYNLESYLCCYFASFLWGMSDCSTQSINCACISEKFGDDIYVFGLYNFTQCLAICFGMINSVIFKDLNLNYYMMIMIVIQILVNYSLNFVPKYKVKINYLIFDNNKSHSKEQ